MRLPSEIIYKDKPASAMKKAELLELVQHLDDIAMSVVDPESTATITDHEDIAELFIRNCLRDRHAAWVRLKAQNPEHPSMARVIELSICAQYQQDEHKHGVNLSATAKGA